MDNQQLINQMLIKVLKKAMQFIPEQKLYEDLELDSLKMMELISLIEEEFDVLIPLNKVAHIRTVGDLYQGIENIESLKT